MQLSITVVSIAGLIYHIIFALTYFHRQEFHLVYVCCVDHSVVWWIIQ